MYHADNDGRFPAEMSSTVQLKAALDSYYKDESTFETLNPDGSEFLGNGLLAGYKASSLYGHETTVTLYDSKIWKEKGLRNVAFMDGHVKFVGRADFLYGLRAEYLDSDMPELPYQRDVVE